MRDQILSLLLEQQRFVVTTHTRPDGDALGAQLALGRFLEKMGKEVLLINSDPPPHNLEWLPGIDAVALFDGALKQREALAAADVLIVVDTNAEERLGKLGPIFKNARAHTLLIDHHPFPETWFGRSYRRESASSTGELIYELIVAHDPGLIDADLATMLYTAIMTDTGSFRYSSVTVAVHHIIADLLERGGIQPADIHSALYDTRTLAGLRLLSRTLDTLTLSYEGQISFMVVPQRVLNETGASVEETEGFVNYALSVEGVRVAMLFTETEKGTKVSFRSKGDDHVHEWAQAFGGGGHRNASGAFIRRSLDVTIEEVLDAAPRFISLASPVLEDEELSPEDAAYLSSLLAMQSKSTQQ